VLANKQDQPNSVNPADLISRLHLAHTSSGGRMCHLQGSSASTPQGMSSIHEVLEWLLRAFIKPAYVMESLVHLEY
jgi:hypothetical protein